MAIVMNMHWPEVSKSQYEETRRQVMWETTFRRARSFTWRGLPRMGCTFWISGSRKRISRNS